MNAVEVFNFRGEQIRPATLDGKPALVLADIAKVLGYHSAKDAGRILRDHHKGWAKVPTPGGVQNMLVITEQGFNRLVIRSNAANAEQVQDFITDEVMPQLSRTGSYSAPTPVTEPDRRQLALMVLEAEDAREAAVQRAVVAESFKEQIELNDGLTVRDFHKKYFSNHRETDINEFFYKSGLLLDERGKRWDEEKRQYKPGKNHRRPTFTGKAFFYLHSELDRENVRREHTRVRPGAPELALVEHMEKRGFTANRSEVEGIAA